MEKPVVGSRSWNGDYSYESEATYTCGPHGRFDTQDGEVEELTSQCQWNKQWSITYLPECTCKITYHKNIEMFMYIIISFQFDLVIQCVIPPVAPASSKLMVVEDYSDFIFEMPSASLFYQPDLPIAFIPNSNFTEGNLYFLMDGFILDNFSDDIHILIEDTDDFIVFEMTIKPEMQELQISNTFSVMLNNAIIYAYTLN